MASPQSYSLDSFITNSGNPSESLAQFFGNPGVEETYRKNGTWRLVETSYGIVYWEGEVAPDGTLLPPDPLPEGFPTFTSHYPYNGHMELQVDYDPDPNGPCPCEAQSCPAGADSGHSVDLLSGRFKFDLPLLDIKAIAKAVGIWIYVTMLISASMVF